MKLETLKQSLHFPSYLCAWNTSSLCSCVGTVDRWQLLIRTVVCMRFWKGDKKCKRSVSDLLLLSFSSNWFYSWLSMWCLFLPSSSTQDLFWGDAWEHLLLRIELVLYLVGMEAPEDTPTHCLDQLSWSVYRQTTTSTKRCWQYVHGTVVWGRLPGLHLGHAFSVKRHTELVRGKD